MCWGPLRWGWTTANELSWSIAGRGWELGLLGMGPEVLPTASASPHDATLALDKEVGPRVDAGGSQDVVGGRGARKASMVG